VRVILLPLVCTRFTRNRIFAYIIACLRAIVVFTS